MSKRAIVSVLCLMACDDDSSSGAEPFDCARLSLAECGREPSCQVLYEDGGQHCGEERIGLRSCQVMTVDECKLDARCETIDGQAVDRANLCIATQKVALGCQELGHSCPPAIVFAMSSTGAEYAFVGGCTPLGFAPFQPDVSILGNSCERTSRCALRSLADCASDPGCATFFGAPINVAGQCVGDAVPVACVPQALGCDDALAIVQDAQGKRYRVGGMCALPGLTYIDAAHMAGTPELAQIAWPQCTLQR